MPRLFDTSSFSLNYKGGEDYPLLITPYVFQRMGYKNLPITDNPIIFFGFDIRNPLFLPKGHTFNGEVWVVGSILKGFKGVTFNKALISVQSTVAAPGTEANFKSVKIMDASSFQDYKEYKLENRVSDNIGIILHSDKKQIERLTAVMRECPLYPLNDELETNIVDKDIELKGPYAYRVNPDTVFKGKVSVIDIFNQQFPKEVSFEKDLFILSIY